MEYVKLVDFIEKVGDGIHGTPEYDENGSFYFVNGSDLAEHKVLLTNSTPKVSKETWNKIKRPLNETTLLLSINGTLGKVAKYNGERIALGKSVCYINLKNNINRDYLFYAMQTSAFDYYMHNFAHGATIKNFAPKQVLDYKTSFPPLPIQQKIASILSTYDTLIENNTKRIRLLEQMAENLYKEWFVRFRFPGHENVEMENGLPKGWKNENLFDVSDVTYGYAFKSNKFCSDASLNPVVRIRDIQDNHTETYTDEICDNKYLIKRNAILIGMDGIFHMCLWNGERAFLNQRVVMLNSKVENVCNYYIHLAIRPQIKYWEQVIAGTTVAHLGDKHLRRVKIIMPDSDILSKANRIIEGAMNEINSLQHQNTILTRQRDLLLPRLMSGKLEVMVR